MNIFTSVKAHLDIKKIFNIVKKHQENVVVVIVLITVSLFAQTRGQPWWLPLVIIAGMLLVFYLFTLFINVLFTPEKDKKSRK